MKRILLVGSVACGKTTLCQRLNGLELSYHKTQALDVVNRTIDTPGEYLERRSLLRGLLVTAAEADVAVFVQDASQERFLFSPGQAAAFPIPVIGVASKADLAAPGQIETARELLALSGAARVFTVSAVTGQGMEELTAYLRDGGEEA